MPVVPEGDATPAVRAFAAEALKAIGEPPGATVTVVRFGDTPALQDELAALVVAGTKQATASSLWELEAAGEGLPQPGDLLLVTDSRGAPHALARTHRVDVVPFRDVTAEFAYVEGEGDRSLAHWRREHLAYYTRVLAATESLPPAKRAPTPARPVACERFRVVYPAVA